METKMFLFKKKKEKVKKLMHACVMYYIMHSYAQLCMLVIGKGEGGYISKLT